MAPYRLRFLEEDRLLLWDRNFLNHATRSAVLQRRAHRVARISSNRIFAPIQALPDGSDRAKLYRTSADRRRDRDGIVVRIIEYTLDDPGRPGQGERHRLLTTLLDAELDPATTRVGLYHERGEEKLALDELKTLNSRPISANARCCAAKPRPEWSRRSMACCWPTIGCGC